MSTVLARIVDSSTANNDVQYAVETTNEIDKKI